MKSKLRLYGQTYAFPAAEWEATRPIGEQREIVRAEEATGRRAARIDRIIQPKKAVARPDRRRLANYSRLHRHSALVRRNLVGSVGGLMRHDRRRVETISYLLFAPTQPFFDFFAPFFHFPVTGISRFVG